MSDKKFNSRTASDISFELLGPCTGDKNCRSCAHFNELLEELKPQASAEGKSKPVSSGDKRQKKLIQDMMGRHQKARVGSKTAVVTHQSKLDFDRWMPSGWQMLYHGEPEDPLSYPGAMWHDQGIHHDELHSPDYKNHWAHMYPGGEDELSHHHVVVLHHPETNNRIKLYDHSESVLNPGDALRTDMYWNIEHYGPHVRDLMHTLNQHARDTTLDLTHNVRTPNGELVTGAHGSFTSPFSVAQGATSGFVYPGDPKKTVYITDPQQSKATTLEDVQAGTQKHNNIWHRFNVSEESGAMTTLVHELGHHHASNLDRERDVEDKPVANAILELMGQAMSGGSQSNATVRNRAVTRHTAGYLHTLRQDPSSAANYVLRSISKRYNARPHSQDNASVFNDLQGSVDRAHMRLDCPPQISKLDTLEYLKTLDASPIDVNASHNSEVAIVNSQQHPWSTLATAMMATSPSAYGTKNLDENYAEHHAAWMLGKGYNRFTQAMAHHFKWDNPHKISTIEDAHTVFDAPCPCCDVDSDIDRHPHPIYSALKSRGLVDNG